jgi:formate/nitrite transporter FocA (FNT family)
LNYRANGRWNLKGGAMLEFVAKAKRYMWDFIEFGFAAVLAIMLVYLVLGKDSGVFILFVAGNVIKFTNDVPAGNLVAFAIIGALLYWVAQRNGKPSGS